MSPKNSPPPRRQRRTKAGKYAQHITREEIAACFHLPSAKACAKLGVGLTVLKRLCRSFGIDRWPYPLKGASNGAKESRSASDSEAGSGAAVASRAKQQRNGAQGPSGSVRSGTGGVQQRRSLRPRRAPAAAVLEDSDSSSCGEWASETDTEDEDEVALARGGLSKQQLREPRRLAQLGPRAGAAGLAAVDFPAPAAGGRPAAWGVPESSSRGRSTGRQLEDDCGSSRSSTGRVLEAAWRTPAAESYGGGSAAAAPSGLAGATVGCNGAMDSTLFLQGIFDAAGQQLGDCSSQAAPPPAQAWGLVSPFTAAPGPAFHRCSPTPHPAIPHQLSLPQQPTTDPVALLLRGGSAPSVLGSGLCGSGLQPAGSASHVPCQPPDTEAPNLCELLDHWAGGGEELGLIPGGADALAAPGLHSHGPGQLPQLPLGNEARLPGMYQLQHTAGAGQARLGPANMASAAPMLPPGGMGARGSSMAQLLQPLEETLGPAAFQSAFTALLDSGLDLWHSLAHDALP